jgi:ABC-type uncharacterized transport system involved in gliding motility auxiliary subunit
MRFNWLKARQTKYAGYVTLYIIVVVGVLAAVNWLANRHNRSFDTTANKRFSLSDQTEKVARNLDQDVTIQYFDRSTDFARAQDLLNRYDTLSPRLTVQYIDPDRQPQAAREVGLRNLGAVYIRAGERREEANSLTEQEITAALIRALKTGERTLCYTTGSGEGNMEETARTGYSQVKEAVERSNYATRAISLLESPEAPADCTVLMVAGPRFDYPEPLVGAIQKYMEGGGNALVMLDPPLQVGQERVSENKALLNMLESWGVVLNHDLVIDRSPVGQIFGLSEVVPLVTDYGVHPVVRELRNVATAFPVSRSVEAKSGERGTAETLLETSASSFATTNLTRIAVDPSRDPQGPFSLAAAGTLGPVGEQQAGGRFVVVGTSAWAANSIFGFNGNRDLFLNMMNWLSADEDLISIRPTEPEDRRLTLSLAQMRLLFWTSVVAVPLVVIFAGISVWWRRR